MTTDITELERSLKAAAENAIVAHERLAAYPYDEIIDISQHEGEQIDIDIIDINEFIEEASPANILALVAALEKAQQRIVELESRVVLTDELSGETLLDVASRTDLVYCDDTGVLEYTNINGCFVKVTAPPDKVIRFRSNNKCIYIRLVDRVKSHENAGIIIDFPKNNNDFIQ